jgi:hypothetical protein
VLKREHRIKYGRVAEIELMGRRDHARG